MYKPESLPKTIGSASLLLGAWVWAVIGHAFATAWLGARIGGALVAVIARLWLRQRACFVGAVAGEGAGGGGGACDRIGQGDAADLGVATVVSADLVVITLFLAAAGTFAVFAAVVVGASVAVVASRGSIGQDTANFCVTTVCRARILVVTHHLCARAARAVFAGIRAGTLVVVVARCGICSVHALASNATVVGAGVVVVASRRAWERNVGVYLGSGGVYLGRHVAANLNRSVGRVGDRVKHRQFGCCSIGVGERHIGICDGLIDRHVAVNGSQIADRNVLRRGLALFDRFDFAAEVGAGGRHANRKNQRRRVPN